MNDSAHLESERSDQEGHAVQRHPILFFDGLCGLCNRFVDFMLKADNRNRFLYAPLQGETARRLLWMDGEAGDHQANDPPPGGPQGGSQGGPETGGLQADGPRSFIFLEKDAFYEQSNAVLLAMRRLGGGWRLIAVLYVFPRPLRDFVYRIIARNRYRWFGRRDACRLPTPEERDRFLS